MRKKLSLSISALLAAVLTCVGTYAQTTQKRLLALSDSARMAYDFPAALELCQKAIRLDSTARSRYEEPLILAQNGLSMMGYCSQPAVIARKVVSLKDFFLYYPLPEGSWRPTPNQLDSTGKHLMARAVYIPDNASEIYYSANDDDGIRNIYKTTLDGDLWSAPALIGERLTSASDEIYPMLSADGQTLYFASKGLYGMGGYDLYVSHWNKDTKDWDVPVNMGFPYSSPYDDLLFMNSEDGKYSLFASNRDCPKDSICIYVLEYDEVPVRKSIDDVEELRQLAALEVMHEGTEEEEAGGQGTEPQNESTRRYVAKLKEVRALRDSLSAYRKHMDELRTMMSTADPERKENIADVIASREEELPALNEALQKAVGQLQEIEMEFLSKGIVPDERKLEA
ncbi:MAG: PD40 domain-containing protein, partial [Bacteroidales bacterium]|nr:PD40 domain-containing protein [Bacteroidales bacterium]